MENNPYGMLEIGIFPVWHSILRIPAERTIVTDTVNLDVPIEIVIINVGCHGSMPDTFGDRSFLWKLHGKEILTGH